MSGHSKWANIRHKKAHSDAKRGKIFTKLIREIVVAAKLGGSEPDMNPRLRVALDKASDANMPKDTVNRAIKRGSGDLDGVTYLEVRYEGYGISGAALLIDCLTDNKTRTVAEVRHTLSKYGGNLGTDGCVSYLFTHCGQFIFSPDVSEHEVMDLAIQNGADDVLVHPDQSIEVICAPQDFIALSEAFKAASLSTEESSIIMRPQTELELSDADAVKMNNLYNALEDLNDVQDIYTNALF